MDKFIGAVCAIALLGLVFGLMLRSWQRRSRRDAAMFSSTEFELGETLWRGRALYQATAPSARPLERLAIPGLAFRGKATIVVGEAGLLIQVDGEMPVRIARDCVQAVGTTSWTIDRGVGSDGLIALEWTPNTEAASAVQSTFRALSADDHLAALAALRTLCAVPSTRAELS